MNDFDDKLKRALEDGRAIEFEREETLRQLIAQTFRSKMRWMVVFLWVEAVAVCVVAVWAGVRLYHAQELKPLIVYATVLIISVVKSSLALLHLNFDFLIHRYWILKSDQEWMDV